ncbi:MAG: acylphosphatase [Deltaproteobacteria bacterium]|nr:acylphosphatase [Deltaproteobacteria bacterium]
MKNKNIASRFLVMQQAYRYGIKGSVQRKWEGAFFIIAEGEEVPLEQFIFWCKTVQLSGLECVTLKEMEITYYKSFEIIRERT